MKKNGFIAMSLLYSFFLVFVTIMLNILVNYSHNRTLMNSVNNKVKNKLSLYDTQTHDTSGALSPILTSNMIPIYFDYAEGDNGVWKKADEQNKPGSYQWFNYRELMWANVAVLKPNANSYSLGDEINLDDVIAYFVWVPRFRYMIFNGNEINEETNKIIKITFENNDKNYTLASNNGNYTTHPAFLLPSYKEVENKIYQDRIDGIWVGKYETTGTINDITVKNGVNPLKLPFFQQYTAGNSFKEKAGISYDARMMKNTEWGVVVYLSQSKYGIKGNPEVLGLRTVESNNTLFTGGTEDTYGFSKNDNLKQSTTGNVYGIYDMVGGSSERMLNYLENNGTIYPLLSALPVDKKNYDLYTQNNFIHGDATLETNSWIQMDNTAISTTNPIFIRGIESIFRYQADDGTSQQAFRLVIPMNGVQS